MQTLLDTVAAFAPTVQSKQGWGSSNI